MFMLIMTILTMIVPTTAMVVVVVVVMRRRRRTMIKIMIHDDYDTDENGDNSGYGDCYF